MLRIDAKLQALAATYEKTDSAAAQALHDVAAKVAAALDDGDKLIERDDHPAIRLALQSALPRLPDGEAKNFVDAFSIQLLALSKNGRLPAYTAEVDDAGKIVLTPKGDQHRVDNKKHYLTEVSTARLEQLFPGRFERVATPSANGTTLDDSDGFLFSSRKLLDTTSGEEVTVHAIYNELKRERVLQSSFSVSTNGQSTKVSGPGLLLGFEKVPTDTIYARLPHADDAKVTGARVLWVVANALAEQGHLDRTTVDVWFANRDSSEVRSEASNAVQKLVTRLELSGAEGNKLAFFGDTWESGALPYALEHGFIASSHDEGMSQRIPDLRTSDVRTPSGPFVLVFDQPVPSLSVEGHEDVYVDALYLNDVAGLAVTSNAKADTVVEAPPAAQTQAPSSERLRDLEQQLTAITEDIRRGKDGTRERLLAICNELESPLFAKAEALGTTSVDAFRAFNRQSWLRRHTFSNAAVSEQQAAKRELVRWVEQARDVLGGARSALRELTPRDATTAPEALLASIRSIDDGIRESDLFAGTCELLREGVKAESVRLLVRREFAAGRDDLECLRDLTSFLQRPRWLDRITFWDNVRLEGEWLGESGEGALWRSQVQASSAQRDLVQAHDAVCAEADKRSIRRLDQLLTVENPEHAEGGTYVANRTERDRLEPSYRELTRTFEVAHQAQSALNRAEDAIEHRNLVKMQEPPATHLVYVSDGKGGGRHETQPNPAYSSWKWRYDMAVMDAAAACSRAEECVNQLNHQRPRLQEVLNDAGFKDHFGGRVADSISWWFGSWASFGLWSYDASQVDGMQEDVQRLIDGLRIINAEVTPVYMRYKQRVDSAIAQRKRDLLEVN